MMKIDTLEFKKALDVVKPALASKEIIEQTTSFAFVEGNVITYNDEICIVLPLRKVDIQGVIKAEELYKFLGKVKDKEFDVTVADNEIIMKAGHAKVGFALNKEVLLPINGKLLKKIKWQELPKDFLHACKFASASASSDSTNPKLMCVHITKEGVVESSDNFRLVIWDLKEQLPIKTTLIPATSIKEVIKINPIKVCEDEGWVHFQNIEGTIISCRTLDEKFVNVADIVNGIGKVKKIKFPEGVIPILDKAEIFTKEQKTDGSVSLLFKDGKLTIKSESTTAWFKETIVYEDNRNFSFSITPYLLKDILKQTHECFINESVLKFKGANWTYLTMLRTYSGE